MGRPRQGADRGAGQCWPPGWSESCRPPAPAAADSAPPLDGSTSAQAAPSCWAIKQLNPSSADGIYWLQTPQLVAPQQFYCDQTTDGGGWVLIGRGREGWTWNYNGQGSIADLRNTPTGTAAFAPDTLPAETVQGLLGGGRVDALADGIRVRRAKDIAGTTYQEMRIMPSNRPNWSWAIGGGELFSSIKVDGVTYGSGNTSSWANGSNQALPAADHQRAVQPQLQDGLRLRQPDRRPEQLDELPVAVRQREVGTGLQPGLPAAEADHRELPGDPGLRPGRPAPSGR